MIRKLDEVDGMIERLTRTRQELEESVSNLSQQNGGDCQLAVLECTDCKCLGS